MESRSFDAQSFLRSRSFSTVYFPSASGIGYYTLSARHQGLFCQNTKFILGLDSIPSSLKASVNSGEAEYLVTDPLMLKEDFMIRQSIYLAVSLFKGIIKTFLGQSSFSQCSYC